jgi:uracil permease
MQKEKFFPEMTTANILLAFQHLFAMFGATVIVPLFTGLNPAVAIFTAGLGTLAFHLISRRKVPVFLGSSFMFVTAIAAVVSEKSVQAAQGGIIFAGLVYVALSFLIRLVGVDRIRALFPPVVTGPVIIVIGLSLAPVGIGWSSGNWPVAILVAAVFIAVSIFAKGFLKLIPALAAIALGYLVCLAADVSTGSQMVDLSAIAQAPLLSPFWRVDGGFFTLPVFDAEAILLIAPIAFVTFMEHLGDISTNGMVVGKDFFADPGLDKTVLGDGIATALAGLLGGPTNTTYSENTGVLAVTKVYDPAVIRLAAVFAMALSLLGKFAAVLRSIPLPVIGGASLILYGMISSGGIRTLAEATLEFSERRTLLIIALVLVLGLGLSGNVTVGRITLNATIIAVATGVLLNLLLPRGKAENRKTMDANV